MNSFPVFSYTRHTDPATGCFYRYVHGQHDLFRPHSHDYYEIFLTTAGQVHHWINGETHLLAEGSLVFIRPADTHGYLYPDEESRKSEYINLAFTSQVADSLFSFLSADGSLTQMLLTAPMPPTITLSSAEKKRLLFLLGQLNTRNWDSKQDLRLQVKVILAEIFAHHFYRVPSHSTPDAPRWFRQLLQDMEHAENFTAGTQRMVELSHKSYEHLSRLMKKHLNLSLTAYVNNLRINYAANLLLNSNHAIADICYLCGFQNLGYFYRLFKQEYGMAPAQFASAPPHSCSAPAAKTQKNSSLCCKRTTKQ